MAVTRSRSVTACSLPNDLYYLAPNFPADRLTVAEIKNILLKHHVSSENCNRKAEFVALFKTKVLPKREKILKTREDTAEAAELAIHQNRFIGVEESSDNDTSAGTLETTGDSDDDKVVVTEKRGSSSCSSLLNPLSNTMSSSEPSSGPSRSHQISKQPTPSPMPRFGVESTLFNRLFNTILFSEPSSGPSKSRQPSKQPDVYPSPMPKHEPSSGPYKSRHTFEGPILSPSPAPKLRTLSEQLEELGGRITSLEHDVHQALIVQSQQTNYLELVVGEL